MNYLRWEESDLLTGNFEMILQRKYHIHPFTWINFIFIIFLKKNHLLANTVIEENGSIWDPDFQNDRSYFKKAKNREREHYKRDFSELKCFVDSEKLENQINA